MSAYKHARPERRSATAPFLFMLSVLVLLGAAVLAGRPQLEGTAVALAEDRPGVLRNVIVRDLVRAQLGADAERPADPGGTSRNFAVERGDTSAEVARRLSDEGIVTRPVVFLLALYDAGSEDTVQAGTYRVSPAMTPRELAVLFERAPGEQLVLRIIEGWRLSEVAAEVQRRFAQISAAEFAAAAVAGRHQHPALRDLRAGTSLEGFLFPDTYFFAPTATADEIVGTLLDTFQRRAGSLLTEAADRRKVRIYDLVTVASIVEREARARSESATVASVYWNRLARGMALDADPTIQYAIGAWRELTLADLELDSPYNTYRRPGLPPTPICSPGEVALKAAAAPESTEFLFFVAKNDGSGEHAFARTLDEQEANRVKYGNR